MNARRGRWPWVVLGLLAALVAAFAGRGLFFATPRLPSYQGKTVQEWADQLSLMHRVNPNDPRAEEARQAMRAMGTNALPFILADVRAKYSFKQRFQFWLSKRAPSLKINPPKLEYHWGRGIAALEALGPIAKPVIPQLVMVATNNIGFGSAALMAVGPDALPAFTNLLSRSAYPLTGNLIGAFANGVYAGRITRAEAAVAIPQLIKTFQSTNAHSRWCAAQALGAVHAEPELCVPLLVEGFDDPDRTVRQSCMQALGQFGDAATAHAGKLAAAFDRADAIGRIAICRSLAHFHSAGATALPVLIRGLQDNDDNVRLWAASGIGELGYQPEQSLPVLVKAFDDRNSLVRVMAVQSTGMFGRLATNAIPDLEQACSDSDLSVRNVASNALNRVTTRPF